MDQVDVPPRYYAGPVVLAAVTRRFYLYHQVLLSMYQEPICMDAKARSAPPLLPQLCHFSFVSRYLHT